MNKEDVTRLYTTQQIRKTVKTRIYYEKYVDLNTTLKACKECPHYSKTWACPEFEEDVLEYWQKYENLELILTKIIFTQEALNTTYKDMNDLNMIIENSLFYERNKLIPQLLKEEKDKNGYFLSVGKCGECEECTRPLNKACRYPEKCRHSIESIGALVSDTLTGVFN